MRPPIVALCGLFLAASLAGCGGAPDSSPPPGATNAPPPGSSPEMARPTTKKGKPGVGNGPDTIPANPKKKGG